RRRRPPAAPRLRTSPPSPLIPPRLTRSPRSWGLRGRWRPAVTWPRITSSRASRCPVRPAAWGTRIRRTRRCPRWGRAPRPEAPGPGAAWGERSAHLSAPGEPLSRPTRGVGHTYPEDASVPPLASGATSGAAGIKPIGSEDDDEDDIRSEVERFDAARIDGGSDFDESSTGRHGEASEEPGGSHGETSDESGGRHGEPSEESCGRHGADDVDPSEVTQRLSVADLAARMGVDPAEMRSADRRRRRRAAPDPDEENDVEAAGPEGRERPGVEPDVERTARLDLPPDITE